MRTTLTLEAEVHTKPMTSPFFDKEPHIVGGEAPAGISQPDLALVQDA